MWDFCALVFDSSGFPPRWACGAWTPGLGWLHVLSDVSVWAAYCLIPAILWYSAARRKDAPFRSVLFLFSLFILLCGLTHLMDAALFWWPAYRLDGVLKWLTAVVSWVAVLALLRVTPRLMALRTPAELEAEIAERRRVEGELRALQAALEGRVAERTASLDASQQRFRAIFHSQFQFIGLMSPAGVLLEANRAALASAGVPEAAVIGKPFWDTAWWTHDPAQQERLRAAVRRAAGGEADRFEASHPAADGTLVWVDFSLTPFRDEAGGVVLLIPEGRDITARKRAEADLRASEERFQAFMTHAPFAAWFVDEHSRIVYANPGLDRLADLPPGSFVGRSSADVFPPEIAARHHDSDRRVRATGRPVAAEGPHVRADGSAGSAYVVKFPIRQPDGRSFVGGVAIDVTERRRDRRALADKTRLLGAVLDSMREAVLGCDPDGRVLVLNRAFRELHGLRPDETPDRLSDLQFSITWHGTDEPCRFEDLPLIRATRGEPTDDIEMDLRTGPVPWRRVVSVTGRPIDGPTGTTGGVVVLRDVSAQKRNEAALRVSEERFRAAMDASLHAVFFLQAERGPDGAVADFRFADLNRLGEALVGRRKEEVIGQLLCELLPVNRTGGFVEKYVRVVETGVPLEEEFPLHPTAGLTASWLHHQVVRVGDGVAITSQDVSERKRAEAALRASEERFRCAFEFAPIGVALTATDGRWLQVNRSLCELTGYAEPELLATDFQSLTHPDDLGADLAHVRHLLAGTVTRYQTEKRYVHKRGHVVHVSLSVSLVRDEGGRPVHFIAHIGDITKRKETERALAANEALLRQFITHSPVAIAMFDRDMRYLQTSDRWVHDYDLSGRTLIGASHYDVFPDIPEHWRAVHRRVLAGAVERCAEDRLQHENGSPEWLEWECRPWLDAGGAVGGVIIFTQVITQRKRAEEALRASEERFRVLFEHSSDAHLIFDEAGGILDCNNAAVALLRCDSRAELLALHPAAFSPEVQPDGRRSLEKCVEMDATARRNGHHRFDWLHRRRDGEVFPCEVTLTPVGLHGRSVLLAVWHDLTERKRAEDRVRASLREKEVLLKEIHHRVKNNLQIVSALLGLQADHTTDPAALAMFAESQGRVKSMAMIHERLYHSPDIARVDFSEYVRRLATDLYRAYKVTEEEIALDVDVDVPPLGIDVAIPCGLLLNELISNCLKHAFADATEGRLRVSLRRAGGGRTVLTVADNGKGLPADFDMGAVKSFGMQLVATLVEQLGGRLEIASDRGTAIAVTFPTLKA
jgi:PAS domain S-box-containing protein